MNRAPQLWQCFLSAAVQQSERKFRCIYTRVTDSDNRTSCTYDMRAPHLPPLHCDGFDGKPNKRKQYRARVCFAFSSMNDDVVIDSH